MDPARARQKFYTEQFAKGCDFVAFYNHRSADFSQEEIDSMIKAATEHCSELPWQVLSPDRPADRCPMDLFIWVDISDEMLLIGLALRRDQCAIGCTVWRKSDTTNAFDGSASMIRDCLKTFAGEWRKREGNIDTLENETSLVNCLQKPARAD